MQVLKDNQKVLKIILLVMMMPLCFYVLNLVLLTLMHLGQYTGTFLRGLYNIVC